MKKFIVALVLVAGIAAVAYASFSSNKQKNDSEKKMEKKKECSHSCLFG
ncbi:MAG TPA: hypothetical protein PLU37_11855 [Chitinophagaceae bacterium]|nr:hypothetical protein [Chitinophagaceae bacterium]MCB9055687.1 hypothetical protein [Chitinophagales bacterium]HPG12219.1 hypothetical protein [Chitinophagaceae bacterium]HRX94825.1 hypothetical protein [Chitinophagaceae bacterium]